MSKFTLGVLLAIVSIVGYVVLAWSGDDNLENARGVFLFATPFIVVLLGGTAIEQLKTKADETKDVVNKRLNGELDGRIRAAVHTSLEQANVIVPNPNRNYGSAAYQNEEGNDNGR